MVVDRATVRKSSLTVSLRLPVPGILTTSTVPPRDPGPSTNVLSLKSECLDKMVLFGQESLNRATREYLEHYHRERNHQGLNGKITDAGPEVGRVHGKIKSRERLGGILRYYHRKAA